MAFVSSVLNLLPWLIFFQGLLLAGVLFSRGAYKSNLYLGSFLVLLSIHGLVSLLWLIPGNRGLAEIYVGLGSLPFFYGPLMYRYVWHSLYRDVKDPLLLAVHFIPGILNFSFYLVLYLIIGRTTFLMIVQKVIEGTGPMYVNFLEWVKILHGLIYCILIIRLLTKHRNSLRKLASSEKHRRWLIALLSVFSLNWVLVLLSALFLWTGRSSQELILLVSGIQLIAFMALLYTLAFFALRFPVILEPRAVREEIRKKLNLPEGFIEETLMRLKKAEADRFYCNTEVTLSSLASELGLHPNALSFIINETQQKGFREYLNSLRLQDFLKQVKEDTIGQTLLTHAFNAGFASKSTFLRAFKEEFSKTPQEYLKKGGVNSHTKG